MNKEETIKDLKKLKSFHNGSYGTAITEAIKALEQQTCDCISRAKALEMLGDEPENWTDTEKEIQEVNDYRWFKSILEELPPVTSQPRWIPVSERLPEDLEPVNITWVNHNPESYYAEIKDKPFTATGVYFNGQWYWWSTLCADILAEYSHNYDDIINDDIEIIAWMPLPEHYNVESEE